MEAGEIGKRGHDLGELGFDQRTASRSCSTVAVSMMSWVVAPQCT
jgi:hypothetical protein